MSEDNMRNSSEQVLPEEHSSLEAVNLNRAREGVPDKCPLSEALVWILTATRPVSIETYKRLQINSFFTQDEKKINIENWNNLYCCDANEVCRKISKADYNIAITKLLAVLVNGDVRSVGIPVNALGLGFGDLPPKYCGDLADGVVDVWYETFRDHPPTSHYRVYTEIPSGSWDRSLVRWHKNILSPPNHIELKVYLSEVCINTADLFKMFPEDGAMFEPQTRKGTQKWNDGSGRPLIIGKEAWLEKLAALFLSGVISRDNSKDSIALTLREELLKDYEKCPAVETIRKDWLRPLYINKNSKEE